MAKKKRWVLENSGMQAPNGKNVHPADKKKM